MAKKPEKPITSQKEYEKRLRRVKLKAFLVITIPSIIVLFLLAVLFSNGKALSIFGVKNYREVLNVFYGSFYVITAIVVIAVLAFATVAITKAIIDFIKGLKNK